MHAHNDLNTRRITLCHGCKSAIILPIILVAILFLAGRASAAPPDWDPDAGLVHPWSEGATVTATSGTNPANVVDGNLHTFWQSGACLPTGYITRPDLNHLLGACAAGRCTSTADGSLSGATDGSSYTAAHPRLRNGSAWLEASLPAPQSLHAIGARVITSDVVTITAITTAGPVVVGALTSADNYKYRRFPAPEGVITALRAESNAAFTLTELAVQSEPCFEAITVDLGQVRPVGWIRTRHWAGGKALSTTLLGSSDGQHWLPLASLDPNALSQVTTRLPAPMNLRYLQVRHQVKEINWAKVYVWELQAYDQYGPYGAPPPPRVHPRTMAELLGVNGIWGWGTNQYSDGLGPHRGPRLYARVASHARNYHNMHWDVTDPDHVPDYDAMAAGQGTEAQWWLNWDREYGAWVQAGLQVEASIQFTERFFPPEVWDDPYLAGYNYGYAFARHFGPTHGVGHVAVMEVGNEPWHYSAAFYRQVLRGMAQGAKAADPAMIVLPAAFQADTPEAPDASAGNYLGARVTAEEAPYLDGLNAHLYSFTYRPDGVRIAVPPEHPESGMHALRNILRFRDANMPGKPVYVTEWGWDSTGAGERCRASECVSAEAQALYAVRGALMLAREGVERLSWYFYANDKHCDTLFCRSGLTGSVNTDFAPKPSFIALEALINTLGDRHFVGVLREDETAWVYLLGDADGTPTHLVAWRPVAAEDTGVVTITLPVNGIPGRAWRLSGASAQGEPAATPDLDPATGDWILPLTATPLVVTLEPGG